jgi:hypothetical protein
MHGVQSTPLTTSVLSGPNSRKSLKRTSVLFSVDTFLTALKKQGPLTVSPRFCAVLS